jgi:tetratricopeptide (TPR) repeat protein
LANAYQKLGLYEEALQAIERYKESTNTSEEIKYRALKSEIYENLGRYEESLRAYKEYMIVSDSTTWAIMQQDTKFVEERHNLEMAKAKETEAKNKRTIAIMACVIALIGSLLVIMIIRRRLQITRAKNRELEVEKQRYEQLYADAVAERDALTNLLAQSEELAPDVKTAVGKRLELLNKFFTAFITNNSDIDRTASREMEELLANKDTFMVSTKLAFAGSHPKFIKYLEERGLTDWEINYCCLYAIGLKGKEVGSYIKMRSHYNNSSEVRQKLGINEHDTNLGIYIRKLLKSFE